MESTRQKKISNLLQEELSEIFRKQAAQMNSGILISVTKVKVSADLSLARIYISVFPTGHGIALLQEIQTIKSQFRKMLGDIIKNQVRIIPELYFHLDDSLDYIDKIDKELKGKGNNPTL